MLAIDFFQKALVKETNGHIHDLTLQKDTFSTLKILVDLTIRMFVVILIVLEKIQKERRYGKMALKPLGSKVLVKPDPEEEKTKGGIILPDTAKKKSQEGVVVAVGEGKLLENGQRVPLSVKVGDRVVFSKYGGTEVEIDGEEYIILDEDSIYAIKE